MYSDWHCISNLFKRLGLKCRYISILSKFGNFLWKKSFQFFSFLKVSESYFQSSFVYLFNWWTDTSLATRKKKRMVNLAINHDFMRMQAIFLTSKLNEVDFHHVGQGVRHLFKCCSLVFSALQWGTHDLNCLMLHWTLSGNFDLRYM